MSSKKCPQCRMVNWAQAAECKRCGVSFNGTTGAAGEVAGERSLLNRVAFVAGLVALFIFGSYVSLRATSEAANYEQRQIVGRAIEVLERSNFGGRAFVLRRLVNYRTSDSWWNRWVGHQNAYAATNFPFEVVTLYPDFFNVPVDDVERAVILLHESYHLAGANEEKAFAEVWREKRKLGWTSERYGQTRLWGNVREFTVQYAPQLFRCGANGTEDCYE